MGVAAAGNLAVFAGGQISVTQVSDRVDIYETVTDNWDVDILQKAVVNHSVVSVQNQLLVAGGIAFPNTLYQTVEIFTCEASSGTAASEAKKRLRI